MPGTVSSINLDVRRNADGFSLNGGVTDRTFTISNTDVALVGQQDCTLTLPNYASTTLVASHDYTAKGSLLSATAANTVGELAVGTTGQFLAANPATATGLEWTTVPYVTTQVITASQSASSNNAYIVGAAGALVSIALPATAAVGSVLKIYGTSANLWQITQGAGQQIHFLGVSTTPASGTLTATSQYDSMELICTSANTTWIVTSSCGNFNLT